MYNNLEYQKNKSRYKATNHNWRVNNPDALKSVYKRAMKKYRQTGKGIYRDMKQNANKRGLPMMDKDIFVEWYDVQLKICVYCGIDENGHGARMTIDRMDNGKGYVDGNICLACNICNKVKSNILTYDEMLFVGKNVIAKKWLNKISRSLPQ